MWKPGTLVECERDDDGLGLVISSVQTGYGTLGPRWDSLVLTSSGRLLTMRNVKHTRDHWIIQEPHV